MRLPEVRIRSCQTWQPSRPWVTLSYLHVPRDQHRLESLWMLTHLVNMHRGRKDMHRGRDSSLRKETRKNMHRGGSRKGPRGPWEGCGRVRGSFNNVQSSLKGIKTNAHQEPEGARVQELQAGEGEGSDFCTGRRERCEVQQVQSELSFSVVQMPKGLSLAAGSEISRDSCWRKLSARASLRKSYPLLQIPSFFRVSCRPSTEKVGFYHGTPRFSSKKSKNATNKQAGILSRDI